jgi:chemotaxis protein methyltransferase CheR
MSLVGITDQEFGYFQRFIFDIAGITLSPAKKAMVNGRLAKRLEICGASSFTEYFRLLSSGTSPSETQIAVDLLTTNETYFFREPKHFKLLRELAASPKSSNDAFRVWSAASSSGEEAYSIAMVLAETLGGRSWEVFGSDISLRVLERARQGHYPMERGTHIPPDYLKKFCRRGSGQQEGTFLVDRRLRNRVQFTQVNLNEPLPNLGLFDVIFLRNVMIYFNMETKRQVIARLVKLLKPGGHLLIGHSESLHEISHAVRQIAPSIYRQI